MYNAQLSLMHGTYKETHTLKLYKPKWFPIASVYLILILLLPLPSPSCILGYLEFSVFLEI